MTFVDDASSWTRFDSILSLLLDLAVNVPTEDTFGVSLLLANLWDNAYILNSSNLHVQLVVAVLLEDDADG